MRLFHGDTDIASLQGAFTSVTRPYDAFDRPFHGFVYKIEGSSQYVFNNKVVELHKNELMYLPEHSYYAIRAENGGKYIIINFALHSPAPADEPTKISFRDHSKVYKLVHQIQHLWVMKNDVDVLTAKSLLYQIMAEIARQQESVYISPEAREKISTAIQYLRQHLYDSGLRVRDLHTLLGMSDTYFRKLFTQVYGLSPVQYINRERIEQAKSLLVSGDFGTIEQVAQAAGFSDVYYFSKVFKNQTGQPPTEWRRYTPRIKVEGAGC
jgi:AraC-like DNA-binding protein